MKDTVHNLVDTVWGACRPAVPSGDVRVHPLCYTGVSVADKLAQVRSKICKDQKKAKGYFTALTDEVAWLTNLRCPEHTDRCVHVS